MHKGSEASRKRIEKWTISPDSYLKFLIYLLKFLSLLYNFFYIPVM